MAANEQPAALAILDAQGGRLGVLVCGAEGKAILLEAAALQERVIADSGAYATDMEDLGYDADPAISDNSLYSVAATNTNGFTLTATAINRQAVDTQCATMSLNQLGVKASAPSSDCW